MHITCGVEVFYFLPFNGYLCYNNVDIKRAHRRVMALGSSQKI